MKGYIPRYVEYLVAPSHCNITDWGDQLRLEVTQAYGDLIVAHSSALEQVALFALAAESVLVNILDTFDSIVTLY